MCQRLSGREGEAHQGGVGEGAIPMSPVQLHSLVDVLESGGAGGCGYGGGWEGGGRANCG